jgi:cytidylate kinase
LELNGEDVSESIRTPEVAAASSRVAAVPGVRKAMVAKQRRFAEQVSVVMEGRDIGTVVMPEAEVKIYLDAEPAVRTSRRIGEMEAKGAEPNTDDVGREIKERAQRDTNRAVSPLMQAPDAVYLDSTGLSIEEVEERILSEVRKRTSNGLEKTA